MNRTRLHSENADEQRFRPLAEPEYPIKIGPETFESPGRLAPIEGGEEEDRIDELLEDYVPTDAPYRREIIKYYDPYKEVLELPDADDETLMEVIEDLLIQTPDEIIRKHQNLTYLEEDEDDFLLLEDLWDYTHHLPSHIPIPAGEFERVHKINLSGFLSSEFREPVQGVINQIYQYRRKTKRPLSRQLDSLLEELEETAEGAPYEEPDQYDRLTRREPHSGGTVSWRDALIAQRVREQLGWTSDRVQMQRDAERSSYEWHVFREKYYAKFPEERARDAERDERAHLNLARKMKGAHERLKDPKKAWLTALGIGLENLLTQKMYK